MALTRASCRHLLHTYAQQNNKTILATYRRSDCIDGIDKGKAIACVHHRTQGKVAQQQQQT